ncbi:MAG: hypothetical protein K8U57_15960 [Planctomycetes bacterium]|nr:hypothetical protein [Planctomycetota bacterium]
MPSVTLTDVATMRFQSISFFLMLFLLVSLLIRWIWNSLRTDFPRLPRLSYPKALALVGLWGMLFLLVLTMISGARELMTPGAWKKDGLTYSLADEKKPEPPREVRVVLPEPPRREKLQALFTLLAAYAAAHDGRYPSVEEPAIPAEAWKTPHATGKRYIYVPNRTTRDAARVLACEPELFGDERLTLFTNGEILRMTNGELSVLLESGGK